MEKTGYKLRTKYMSKPANEFAILRNVTLVACWPEKINFRKI